MPLIKNRYGKGRVRVMRIHRDGDRHEVSQLNVKAMIEGDFARAYTDADNSTSVSTDTIKNVVNVVARENTGLCTEEFCQVLAKKYLDLYPQVVFGRDHGARDQMEPPELRRQAASAQLRARQQRQADRRGRRGARRTSTHDSGIDGFTFMKSTQSGWENYVKDPYTTIPPTNDRMCATAWWRPGNGRPSRQAIRQTNAKILDTVLEVFGTTYSASVQDSLYRMGEAALAAVPEISEISMACPNMHFILMNLSAFGLDNNNDVFLPTDEPHGQIECTVGRG